MTYTAFISYFIEATNSIESGKFEFETSDEYFEKLGNVLDCKIWVDDTKHILLSHSMFKQPETWIGVDAIKGVHIESLSDAFEKAMETIHGKANAKLANVIIVKGNQDKTPTTEFKNSMVLFEV